jgi:SNF2 family DNA or RNA helicase
MEKPPGLIVEPHPWQLTGAAQAHWLCYSVFRGAIIGDQMGFSKTLLAILCMWLAREEPGSFSVVVCPKSCQAQWVDEIENSFEPVVFPTSSLSSRTSMWYCN